MGYKSKVLFHATVMAGEVINFLDVVADGAYVDMTLGDGGHSIQVLKRLGKNGSLIAFDKDAKAIQRAEERIDDVFHGERKNVTFINRDFAHVKDSLAELGVQEVSGFIFDLGLSFMQLNEAERGFSFLLDARLDMRMDRKNKIDAHYLVNRLSYDDLHTIIREYGEERFAKRIARSIVRERMAEEIETTKRLADIVSGSIPRKYRPKKIHPATRTFQALRIKVNDELVSLENGLKEAVSMLKQGGRACVISFHSLEDRIVKRTFKDGAKGCNCPKEVIYCQCGIKPYLKLVTRKPVTPSADEVSDNPKARSAKLRVAERI